MVVSNLVFEAIHAGEFSAFIDSREHQTLAQFARALPLAVQAHALELKLAGVARHADYLVCLDAQDEPVRAVRQNLERQRLSGTAFSPIDRYLEHWAGPDAGLREQFPVLWLEWDRPEGVPLDPPGLFIAPVSDLQSPAARLQLGRSLSFLYAPDAACRYDAVVEHVRRHLPAAARVRHLGAMPSRHAEFLRLVVEGVEASAVAGLLARLGWPGDRALLSELLDDVGRNTGLAPALLDLDFIGRRASPALGLEFLLVGSGSPGDDGAAFLDHLQRRGWCGHEKARALVRWLTWSCVRSPESAPHAFWQKLYHIKLTLSGRPATPGQHAAVSAKAYWGVWSGPSAETLSALHAALKKTFAGDRG